MNDLIHPLYGCKNKQTGKQLTENFAQDVMTYNSEAIERVLHYAFRAAQARRKKVSLFKDDKGEQKKFEYPLLPLYNHSTTLESCLDSFFFLSSFSSNSFFYIYNLQLLKKNIL